MKKYFAKWLPIEGEIKKGDKYIIGKSLGLGAYTEGYTGTAAIDFTENAQRDQKAKRLKLFLCSRDIQVGDRAKWRKPIDGSWNDILIDEKTDIKFLQETQAGRDLIKVIGEISPKATWVKEGDEFDEEDIEIESVGICDRDGYHCDGNCSNCNGTIHYHNEIHIKCPHCGTFT